MAQAGYTPISLYYSTTASTAPTSGNLVNGELAINITDGKLYYKDNGGTVQIIASKAGASGDVVGPASATDNAIVRFDGTTGKLVQNSVVTIADSTGDISGVGQLNATTLDATNIEVTNIKAKDGTAAASIADSTGVVSITANPVLSGGTANGVLYLNGSKVATSGSALTFDGTIAGLSGALTIGGGSVSAGTKLVVRSGATDKAVSIDNGANSGFIVQFASGLTSIGNDFNAPLAFLQNNAEQMRLTSTGLGIGVSSVGYKLQVASGATAATSYFSSTATPAYSATAYNGGNARIAMVGGGASGATTGINFSQGGSFEAYFGGVQESGGAAAFVWQGYNGAAYVERMRLDSSGNLGLGVTPSGHLPAGYGGPMLQVGGRATMLGNATTAAYTNNTYYASGFFRYIGNDEATMLEQIDGQFRFYTAPSGTAGNAITFTQAMTLDSSGNLGIGTSSPSYKLDVKGNIRANITASGDGTGVLLTNDGSTNGRIEFLTSDATGRYRLDGIGDSGFAISTISGGVWGQALYIDRVSRNLGLGGSAVRATTAGSAIFNIFNGTAPVGTLTNGISLYSSSGEAYVMDAAGNATLFSPHDRDTNEWIFRSKHTPSGKVLKIDVERLLRFVNDHFGLDAVQEFIEP